jgi:hypothetical protein
MIKMNEIVEITSAIKDLRATIDQMKVEGKKLEGGAKDLMTQMEDQDRVPHLLGIIRTKERNENSIALKKESNLLLVTEVVLAKPTEASDQKGMVL